MDYQTFRQAFEEQHPASIPVYEEEVGEYPDWVRHAVLVTFVAAALVSGVHTVPTVWKGIETGPIITDAVRNIAALAALAMVEFAILLSAYLMAKGSRLAYAAMALAGLAAVTANLFSVVTAYQKSADGGAILVAVLMGIAAPLIALLMGKMFVDMHRAARVQQARAKRVYKDAQIAWDAAVEIAWKAFQKGEKRESSRTFMKSGEPKPLYEPSRNPVKPRVKLHEVAQKIQDAGDERLTVAEMMDKYHISQGSTTKIRDLLSGNGNGNGHHKEDDHE